MSDTKVKETMYLNFKNKKEEKKKKITDWVNSQDNVTNSILSLIEHSIDRFGNRDIMDHDISRKLYMERLFFDENDKSFTLFPTSDNAQPGQVNSISDNNESTETISSFEPRETKDKTEQPSQTKSEKTHLMNNINSDLF
ncbi:hypothetical protein [Cytobacillus oceanisediminis]|uniref:hypothetical protein n=1 Tax=Cytobacillus oceanisediminis TaxID=665099 RepID=UPI00203DC10D|nr:hypothetical protein [Cytobacillus oceanisediminis]MCM3405451.1 hypothetical protein [Cytobacillus oceanisediminis]